MQPEREKTRILLDTDVTPGSGLNIVISSPDQDHQPSFAEVDNVGGSDNCVFLFQCKHSISDQKFTRIYIGDTGSNAFSDVEHFRPKSAMLFRVHGKLSHELWTTQYALTNISIQQRETRSKSHYSNEYFLRLIVALLRQFKSWKIKVDTARVCQIIELAKNNPRDAYEQLAALFQHSLAQKETRLQRQLKVLTKLLAIFCSLFLLPYSLRNLITMQRSWFLNHGSHPADILYQQILVA